MSGAPFDVDALAAHPNPLWPHYSRFDVGGRVLLSGHSHQAWPDVAFEAQQQAWLDAARWVDDKWSHAFERAERVRRGWARLLRDDDAEIAIGPATHDLLVKLLSALPLRQRPRLVTTDGEFHTIRRQLARLAEEGVEVAVVSAQPSDAIAERLADAVDDRTAAVFVSSVLFRNAHIVPGLDRVAAACARVGAELVVDAYHHLNVVPFSIRELGLADAFVTGGGYKYAQLGEGNAFLRVPPGRRLRPAVTGWFSEFSAVTDADGGRVGEAETAGAGALGPVRYGRGADRFAGATYDPVSQYRAAAVFDFFESMRLTPELLREVSRHQIRRLAERFDALDLDPAVIDRQRDAPLERIAGFLALRSPLAGALSRWLRERGVYSDYRDDVLRLGPAPYLSDAQIQQGIDALGAAAKRLSRGAVASDGRVDP